MQRRPSLRKGFFAPSPNQAGLLRGSLDIRHVFSSVLSDQREPCGLSWLDLAKARLRLDRLCRNGGRIDFLPLGFAHSSREPRKSHRRRPPLRSGPKDGCSSIAFGLQIAIEAAMVAGSNSKGEVIWQASAPSRSRATSFRAKS